MLKKLMKHEFRATRRFFLPAYVIFAVLLVVERLSLLAMPAVEKSDGILGAMVGVTMTLITAITVIGLIVLMAAPVIYNIIRFYRNMLGDEGYLTFTLPVSTGQLIGSKLLTAVVWEILTGIVVILCGGAFLATLDVQSTREFFEMAGKVWNEVWCAVGGWTIVLVVVILFAMFSQLFVQMLTLYTSMSIGQCAGKHRLLASAGCYVGINCITSWLLQIPMSILTVAMGNEQLIDWLDQILTEALNTSNYVFFSQIMVVILLIAILGNALLGTVHYFLSRYFLTKKLNLA